MNRKIEFRVWHIQANEFVWPQIVAVDGAGFQLHYNNGWREVRAERFVVQQFTGLHDKNGKEIYEGDILGADSVTGTYEVYWSEHQAAWAAKGGTAHLPAWLNSFTLGLEVIGNIYENPELLTFTQ